MSPTDEELDRDWQPNGRRPQSYVDNLLYSASYLMFSRSLACELDEWEVVYLETNFGKKNVERSPGPSVKN